MKKFIVVENVAVGTNNGSAVSAYAFDTEQQATEYASQLVLSSANQAQVWHLFEIAATVRTEKSPVIVEKAKKA